MLLDRFDLWVTFMAGIQKEREKGKRRKVKTSKKEICEIMGLVGISRKNRMKMFTC